MDPCRETSFTHSLRSLLVSSLLPTDPSCELASPTDSDLLSPLLLVSPTLHLSPPPSPPPKPKPEMSFKVRPFTHPGYLFGNFPPSAKKVLCGVCYVMWCVLCAVWCEVCCVVCDVWCVLCCVVWGVM